MSEYVAPHLTDAQIIDMPRLRDGDAALLHVQSCADCRERVARWREAEAMMGSASGVPEREEAGGCPSAEELAAYLLGEPGSDRWDAVTAHVVHCDRCAAVLRDSLDDDAEGREPAPLLPSSTGEWRRRLAKSCTAPSAPVTTHYWKYAAAAVLLIVAGSMVWWRYQRISADPAHLLAVAYTEARPFEYRLPDSGYAPVRQQRGAGSAFGRPESLDAAVADIRRDLAAQPRSTAVLALRGRAELLLNENESAIETLEGVIRSDDRDTDALTDLAVAYAQRGVVEKGDYGHAMDLFLRALRQRPANPRIQFNLALIYEKLSLVDEAIEEWRKFLSGNPPEGWRKEASTHLAEMEKTKAEKKRADERILRDPLQFVASYGSVQDFDPLPWYDVFWTEWLPRSSSDSVAARAARMIASGFTRYGEYSLLETVEAPSGPGKDSALAVLARAMVLNHGGHPGEALAPAREAVLRFDAAGMRAAAAVARGEILYATRWADLYGECQKTADALFRSTGPRYPWVEGNARLDHSSCLWRSSDAGPARIEIEKAEVQLEKAGLWPMALRATQFAAAIDGEIGNYGPVWETAPAGLRRYWTTAASGYRAQGFHFILQQACSALSWNECSVVLYRAAIRSAHDVGNGEMEVSNRSQLAELLQQMGDYPGELRELIEVNHILDGLGQSRDVRTLRWEADRRRVEADLATKAAVDPLPELDRLAADAAGREARQRIVLEQDRGIAFQSRGDFVAAADAFSQAIELNWKLAQSANSWILRIPAIESVAASYRNLTLIELMREHDPAKALATWRRFRPSAGGEARSVVMAVLPRGIVVWTAQGESVTARWVEKPVEELRNTSEELLALCSSPASSAAEIRRMGHKLYSELLRPELQTLASGTIVLNTESWLSEIPFGALTDDSGEYLRHRFQFVQGYGPPMDTPAGRVTAASAALIVKASAGVAPSQPPLAVLPAAEQEADQVAARFPHAVTSGAATVEWIAENAARANVFHFSGHGWANGGNGALILPPGPNREPRFVTSRDLARQNWSRCQLAVLSACLTASGETRGSVNNQSLVQAFLSAGARRVVAARWSVDSDATRALMESFYAKLASGKSVPEALFGAEADVAAAQNWSHPYYWAGFDVFGAA